MKVFDIAFFDHVYGGTLAQHGTKWVFDFVVTL
jgi:hypothetical protein